jgi:hypothetical protein
MSRPYTLTSDDLDALLIGLRHKQDNDRECASLAAAIGYSDAERALKEEIDHAEGLVRILERSDLIDVWPQ